MVNTLVPSGHEFRDSFDEIAASESRGVGLVFDRNGDWSRRDGGVLPDVLMGMGATINGIEWHGPGQPPTVYPEARTQGDVDALNAKTDKSTWKEGLDGKPRPPVELQYSVHLVDPESGGLFTAANATSGQRIGTEILIGNIKRMRLLRGAFVAPLIKLSTVCMSNKYRTPRPEYEIVGWRDLDSPNTPVPPQWPGSPVDKPTTSELIGGDGIPFDDSCEIIETNAVPPAKKRARS
jgi:hypothetical protein